MDEHKKDIKLRLFGYNMDGSLFQFLNQAILLLFAFIFIYPLIKMVSYSFMSLEDLTDPMVGLIPRQFYLKNYTESLKVLDYRSTLIKTVMVSLLPALLQTLSTSLAGYGLARFDFPGKKLILFLVIASFMIPDQVLSIPQFLMFKDMKLLGTLFAYLLPAVFGQGFKSSIFILIFYAFFKQIPQSLEEAAEIDGAKPWVVFTRVAVPIAFPAYFLTFVFSFVFYWNETYLAAMLLGKNWQTLPLKLQQFSAAFEKMYPKDPLKQKGLNEAVEMAGTFLNILPLLVFYFFIQKKLVKSVDKAGITGE